MAIRRQTIAVTGATGGAGVATISAIGDELIEGEVIAVYLEYLDSPPGTTDVVIREANNSPALPIFSAVNANTSGWFYPEVIPVSTVNGAITDAHRRVKVADYPYVSIAQANDGDGVNVTIVWDDLKD